MLIQSLCQYYEKNEDKISGGVPKYFEVVEISHTIYLTPEGKISGIQRSQDDKNGGNEKIYPAKKDMILPKRSEKSANDVNIAECRSNYIFGLNYDKKADSFVPEKSMNNRQTAHEWFVNGDPKSKEKNGNLAFVENLDSPIINAFREFLINWNPENETENLHLKAIAKEYEKATFCFALEGRPDVLLHEDALFKKKYTEWVENTKEDSEIVLSMCPVEGEMLPVARIHNKIKKIPGGQGNKTLISFDNASTAFQSYGKRESRNSNISEKAMKKYTAALNYLLKNSQHHLYLDDMTLFYFGLSPDEEEECDYFSQFFNSSEDEGEGIELSQNLHAVAKAFKDGTVPDISVFKDNSDFIIAGITHDGNRIAVKFLLRGTFGNVMKNLFQHQNDMRTENCQKNIPMWRIFKELVPRDKSKNGNQASGSEKTDSSKKSSNSIPSPLQASIMNAILNGTRYPDAMLHTVLNRLKHDDSMGAEFGAIKIGIIKAYLNRKARLSNNKEEITLALNTENKNPAYLCGRLFAVLEKVQQKASDDKLNRTIKDSYFASACARPVSVFPRLVKLSQYHIAKLDNDTYWQKLIGEIMSGLDEQFPSTMSPDNQGSFIIGYYQQRNTFFEKKPAEAGKEE